MVAVAGGGSMTLGRIYVQTDQILNESQLNAVRMKLKEFPDDFNLTGVTEKKQKFSYTTIEKMSTLRDTLEKYNKIHMHYGFFSDSDYVFINMSSSKENSIDINEDIIEFTTLKDRNCYSSYHGHVNIDGSVDIFTFLPFAFQYKCIKIPDGYRVSNNVCQIFRNDFVFYIISKVMLTTPHKAISVVHNTNIKDLSEANIRSILDIFSENQFSNININQDCIYANDDNVLMVVGVISEQILGSFAKYVADLN